MVQAQYAFPLKKHRAKNTGDGSLFDSFSLFLYNILINDFMPKRSPLCPEQPVSKAVPESTTL